MQGKNTENETLKTVRPTQAAGDLSAIAKQPAGIEGINEAEGDG